MRIKRGYHSAHNEGQSQSVLHLNFKSIGAVHQRYISSSGTTPVNLETLIYIGTTAFPLFDLRRPRDFKVQVKQMPKGNLVQQYMMYIPGMILLILL